MSVRLGMLFGNQRDEALEEVVAVVGAGGGLGVVLDREDGPAVYAQVPSLRAVEERDVGRLDHAGGQGLLGDHLEAVVLASDLDT